MKSYKLTPTSGKISAALCKLCSEGGIGEFLIRDGMNQASFCLFLAKLAHDRLTRSEPVSIETLADIFSLVSGGNTSAAQKALGGSTLLWEQTDKEGESILDKDGNPTWEEKGRSVDAHWLKQSGGKVANLSLLD